MIRRLIASLSFVALSLLLFSCVTTKEIKSISDLNGDTYYIGLVLDQKLINKNKLMEKAIVSFQTGDPKSLYTQFNNIEIIIRSQDPFIIVPITNTDEITLKFVNIGFSANTDLNGRTSSRDIYAYLNDKIRNKTFMLNKGKIVFVGNYQWNEIKKIDKSTLKGTDKLLSWYGEIIDSSFEDYTYAKDLMMKRFGDTHLFIDGFSK